VPEDKPVNAPLSEAESAIISTKLGKLVVASSTTLNSAVGFHYDQIHFLMDLLWKNLDWLAGLRTSTHSEISEGAYKHSN
jgi:hypothetical protein